MKRATAFVLALALMLTLSPALGTEKDAAEASPRPTFSDVPAGAWYAPYVEVCVGAGLMNGTGANTFSPDHYVTVAECHVIAARLHSLLAGGDSSLGQIPAVGPEYQIPDGSWYGDSVRYLSALPGADNAVYSDYYDSRAMRSQFLALLVLVVPDTRLTPINQINSIPDADDPLLNSSTGIPHLSVQEILRFYNAGILSGTDGRGTFSGQSTLTRAEAATTLARILKPELRLLFSLDSQPIPDLFSGLPGTVRLATEEEIAACPSVLPYQGESEAFSEGYAVVGGDFYLTPSGEWNKTKMGMVDTDGNWVIPQIYALLNPFHNGMAVFAREDDVQGSCLGYLSTDGVEHPFDPGRPGKPADFVNGYANFYAKKYYDPQHFVWKEGLVDTGLNEVVPALFDRCCALPGGQILIIENESYYLLTLSE